MYCLNVLKYISYATQHLKCKIKERVAYTGGVSSSTLTQLLPLMPLTTTAAAAAAMV